MQPIELSHAFEGPFNAGCYDVRFPSGEQFRVNGKAASLISLILAGYRVKNDFHPFEAFDPGSLRNGQAAAKVADHDG